MFLDDLASFDSARPVLILGSATDTWITDGSLAPPNGRPVEVSGLTQLKFVAGPTSEAILEKCLTGASRGQRCVA